MKHTVQRRQTGFTLVELLVVMAIIALLLGLLLPALAKARATARQVKDATQLKQIHTAWLTWSNSLNGVFPTPGLINRVGTIPGKGVEDGNQNDHAALYSACIAQNYFSPQLCISPSEASANVANAATYNYNAYNVAIDKFWDELNFKARLDQTCNVSYGTLQLEGGRKSKQWKNTIDSKFAVLANRGVKDGLYDAVTYNKSKTLEIHGGRNSWEGNICFNDTHVSFEPNFSPEGTSKIGTNGDIDDNIFKDDTEANKNDIFLTIVWDVTGSGPYEYNVTWD